MSSSQQASFDVARQHVATVYARGLLGAAAHQDQAVPVLAELDSLIDDVLDRLPKLEAALASPRISAVEKQQLLQRAFATRMRPVLLTFLKVLARRGRLDCLRQIRGVAHHLLHDLVGQVEVQVQTAQPVTAAVLDQITQQLTMALQRQVVLTASVEPELLGGVVVRIGDTVYDGSLDNQLQRLRSGVVQQAARQARETLRRFVVSEQ